MKIWPNISPLAKNKKTICFRQLLKLNKKQSISGASKVWFLPLFLSNTLLKAHFCRANKLHNQMTRHHRRDTTMVALLFSIVIVFLVCHSSKLVLNMYEAVQVSNKSQLCGLNHKINICICRH